MQNIAGLVPSIMMAFALSAMWIHGAGGALDGTGYVNWLAANAALLRLVIALVFVPLLIFAAFHLVKRWRDFAIFPQEMEEKIDLHIVMLWPVSVLAITYIGSVVAYAHYAWIYEACGAVSTIAAITGGASCHLDAAHFSTMNLFAADQFVRGVFGDFFELVGPVDPAHEVSKDAFFIVVTGLYRLFAQTALFVIPLSIWTCGALVWRRVFK